MSIFHASHIEFGLSAIDNLTQSCIRHFGGH